MTSRGKKALSKNGFEMVIILILTWFFKISLKLVLNWWVVRVVGVDGHFKELYYNDR